MALTLTKVASGVKGNQRYWQGNIQFDSSYPTGGEAITAASFGMHTIKAVSVTGGVDTEDRVVQWDQANSKLEVIVMSTGAQAANASDQSAVDCNVVVDGN